MDERAFTRFLATFFPTDRRRVPVGIGDDGAVVRNARRETVVVCDPVVEGVHFAPGTPWQRVGRKAVNRNLSDLAAMGAVPDYLVASVVLPRGATARQRRALFTGLRDAAHAGRCLVVGGDVASSLGPLTVTVTALGHLEGKAKTRAGARPGDWIHVTGPLGGSLAGHHLTFRPALAEGRWLARQRAVTAAIDVSDGLVLDLATLLEASGGLGAELEGECIPLSKDAQRLEQALYDGEDHVLLFTVRGALPRGGPLTAQARVPLGRVVARPLVRVDGRRVAVRGYQHRV